MKRKKLLIILMLIIAAIIIVIVVLAAHRNMTRASVQESSVSVEELVKETEQLEIAAAYCCDLGIYGEDNSQLWVYFDVNENTFVNQIGDEPVAQGSYTTNGNEIITSVEDEDGNEVSVIRYLLDGEYLLIEDGVYNGEIPDGDTFEAVVEKTDSLGNIIRYTFREDGTYTCLEIPEDTEEKDGTTMEGTYTRDGNVIQRTLSGNEMIPFYVYEGYLFPSYYVETDADTMGDLSE